MPVTRVVPEFNILDQILPFRVSVSELKMAALTNGKFVAVWRTFDATDTNNYIIKVHYRIMNADGSPASAEITLPPSTTTEKLVEVDIDLLPDGRFLLSWQTIDNTGGTRQVWAQSFNADGSASTAKVALGSFSAGAEIAVLPDGSFFAAREVPWNETGQPSEVHVQKYGANGVRIGNEIALTSSEQGLAYKQQIATLVNGQVAVVWYQSSSAPGYDNELGGIRACVLNADGSQTRIDFAVNTTTSRQQDDPQITALAAGGFVVTWESDDTAYTTGSCIRARVFNAAGTPLGNDFIVNSLALGSHYAPDIAALNDGRFVVTWESRGSATGGEIRAKLFNADGTSASDEFVVNQATDRYEAGPTVQVLDDGKLLFTWTYTLETSLQSFITSTIFDPGIVPINGTAGNDSINGTLAGDSINGLAGNDSIYGKAGRDILNGGDGNDYLYGGKGADAHNGGAGYDFARYDDSSGSVSASLSYPVYNTGEAAGDTYSGIEGLVGSIYGDYLVGDTAANYIFGLSGNDWIDGMGGSDNLYGDAGDDHMISRAGVQVLRGGDGFDFARYDYATAGVTAALYNPALNNGDAAGDVYDSIEGLVGGAYADYLYGNSAANALYGVGGDDWLDGLGGYDILVGGDGNDNLVSRAGAQYFDGGAGFDYVRYETSNGGVAVVLYSSNYNTGEAKGDTYIGIEGVVGSLYDDAIYGDGASNYLFGSNGNDTLDGVGGRDYLYGGDGNDSLISRAGAEAFDGGAGADLVRYVYATAALVASLANSALNTGEAEGDTYVGVENLLGSGFDDYLYGDSAANTIYGGAGNDWLVGSAGGDTLTGEAGNDKLVGGIGRDGLTGGAGSDTFIFYSASESGATSATGDVIRDFRHLTDLIDLSAIDAKYSTVANDSFTFIGSAAFTAEGQIRAIRSGANTLIEVNAGGMSGAETSVLLAGVSFTTITANDFIL
jgi:Ca2+-binding RTX toxin-like protein